MEDSKQIIDRLTKEIQSLRQENEELKAILRSHGIEYVRSDKPEGETLYSSVLFPTVQLLLEERVSLFHSLFRGRDDVFARRWFSKATGKSGYQPVCANEWRHGICDKKTYKCSDCPNRELSPLTSGDIYRHLEGRDENGQDVIGLYPIMSDNQCSFLCADFDDKSCIHGYKNDVLAYVSVCRDWHVPYGIERSRSGNGAHAWIFFETPLPAYKARKLGNAILTEATGREGQMVFNSYDRFFPNQDRMPEGGFGNLVALPLQGRARKNLNSVFVDDSFLAYKDQWAFLSQIQKVSEEYVDVLLSQHVHEELGPLSTSSESKPWKTPEAYDIHKEDFLKDVIVTKADKLYIPMKSVSAKVLDHLKRIASFRNPEFYSRQAMHFSTYSFPRIISCFDMTDDYLAMPRGCEGAIMSFLDMNHVDYSIKDETNHGMPIDVRFLGEERVEQTDAINAILPYDNGVLHATTAFGKTVTATAIIARKRVNTLIIVHSRALLVQWKERLEEFLEIKCEEPVPQKKRGRRKAFSPIGCLDSTGDTLHGIIDIVLMQSCMVDGEPKSFIGNYGMVIVDECHHVPSVTFENVMKSVRSKYVYGLTATPIRKDGHQPIIFMQCGPIRFSADARSQIARQSFDRYLIPRFTTFRSLTNDKMQFAALLERLAEDEVRNRLIVEDVSKAVVSGRTPIIMTSRMSHVSVLAKMLEPLVNNVICLTGAGTAKEKRDTMCRLQSIPTEESLVIVATGKYVGEGFDYPRLDTLFLALPISWKGLVAQYAGRLHRENEGKKDVCIFDYIDIREPVCDSMYRKRLRGYASIGYRTIDRMRPTLFDEADGMEPVPKEGQIFSGRTFLHPYLNELNHARRSIVISSPKLYAVEKNSIMLKLKGLSVCGIEVVILTSCENGQTEILRSNGLVVRVQTDLKLCSTVIDKSIVWYGGVNVLGYASDDDSMIKVDDINLAVELTDLLLY